MAAPLVSATGGDEADALPVGDPRAVVSARLPGERVRPTGTTGTGPR